MKNIVVYGKPNCYWCSKVTDLLTSKNYAFTYLNVKEDSFNQDEFNSRTNNAVTVPQVIVGDTLIGSYCDTVRALDNGAFQQVIGGH